MPSFGRVLSRPQARSQAGPRACRAAGRATARCWSRSSSWPHPEASRAPLGAPLGARRSTGYRAGSGAPSQNKPVPGARWTTSGSSQRNWERSGKNGKIIPCPDIFVHSSLYNRLKSTCSSLAPRARPQGASTQGAAATARPLAEVEEWRHPLSGSLQPLRLTQAV